jgi:hypothetical protein
VASVIGANVDRRAWFRVQGRARTVRGQQVRQFDPEEDSVVQQALSENLEELQEQLLTKMLERTPRERLLQVPHGAGQSMAALCGHPVRREGVRVAFVGLWLSGEVWMRHFIATFEYTKNQNSLTGPREYFMQKYGILTQSPCIRQINTVRSRCSLSEPVRSRYVAARSQNPIHLQTKLIASEECQGAVFACISSFDQPPMAEYFSAVVG